MHHRTDLSGMEVKLETPRIPAGRTAWTRRFAMGAAAVFLLSTAFPVVAGISKDTASFPKWWGPLDVGLSLIVAVLAFVVLALAGRQVDRQAQDAAYRAYRILIHGIFAMILVFFLAGDRIVWINCLTGLAWRTWLLLYVLPAWFTVLSGGAPTRELPRGS